MSRTTLPRPARPAPEAGDAEGVSVAGSSAAGWLLPGLDEADLEVDPDELREFLAGDLLDPGADPVFKERLRDKLWRLVRVHYGTPGVEGDDG
jgi:hypothetical protein